MTQQPKRRPKPITQRDGTNLASANCRMASISTGLDFHTVGARTATAGKMRTYTSDQAGGTGSDDAKEAWTKGYKQGLVIKDGGPWSGVIAALREGRGVNLDVWHEYLPGGCISGEGRYGHNIFVLPDFDGKGWLVSDPWCKPAKWQRIPESQLKRAAEKWGAMVRSQTGATGTLRDLIERARELMRLWQPNRQMPPGDPLGDVEPGDEGTDTGGYTPIMFTTTNRQPLATSGGGTVAGPTFTTTSASIGKATVKSDVSIIATSDGQFHATTIGLVRNVSEVVTISDGNYKGDKAYLVSIPGTEEMGLLLAAAADYVPSPPATGDNEARDAEWREWLLAGSPGED